MQIIEAFDDLDFPRQEPEARQPGIGVEVCPGDRCRTKAISGIATTDAHKCRPEIAQCFREWRQGQFRLQPGLPLWRPRSFQLALQMLAVGVALFIDGRESELALRKIDQILSERGVKDFSLATNSMA